MHVRSRWVLGFCGLAIAGPVASTASAQVAQPYAPPPGAMAPSPGGSVINLQQVADPQPAGMAMTPGVAPMSPAMGGPMTPGMAAMPPGMGGPMYVRGAGAAPVAAAPAHHHHGLLARRHCVECQRAHAKAVDGVDIPPPPGYPGAPAMAMAPGETIISGPVVVSERIVSTDDPGAPGHAVVGGPDAAGYAVVNGGMPASEPTPIGMARASQNGAFDPRMAAAMPRPGGGAYDPAVMPTSVPPPPSPMSGPGHNRPHVISHMLGLPILGKHHAERAEKRRELHSAEAYGPSNEKVTDLPASMVYSRR